MGDPPGCNGIGSISRSGKGLGRLINLGYPTAGCHDPLSVIDTAHICLVNELGATSEPRDYIAIDSRCLHLSEIGGHHAEGHHKLGHILVGSQTKCCRRGIQRIVLHGAQVVVHGAPCTAAQVGLVDHLVISRHIVGAGDDLIQPYRLGRQGNSDR